MNKDFSVKESFNFFERNRRLISAAFAAICLTVVLFSHHSWEQGSAVDNAFDIGGVVLIVMGVLGRLWSTMYIGGKKNAVLVQDGPYSMCRNPLYFFSFVAGIGVCVELENVLLLLVFAVTFSFYYPFVIKSEEKRLEGIFGTKEFNAFRASTPAFFPNIAHLKLGAFPDYSPKLLWKNFMDGSIFLLFIPIAYFIERLHESGVLPVLLRIP